MDEHKVIKIGTIITKIFLIWLLIQFLVQTFVTYRLHLSGGFWSVVWLWKEIILLVIAWFLAFFLRRRKIREARWTTLPIKKFVMGFVITIAVSFIVSLFINQSGLSMYFISIRYSMTGFFTFIVFFVLAYMFFGTREMNLTKRYAKVMKTLLVCSLARRGIIWLMPNLLSHVGYNQYNYEWTVGIAPPAAYYTQYDSGYVRNQFLFERPISRGFFLIAFWPLFFIVCIKKKPRSEKAVWGGLYGLAILSTFSRAARIAWAIQIVLLVLMQMNRKSRRIAIYTLIPVFLLFAGVTFVGRDQIITREFSNTGHFRLVIEALKKVADRPIWWQWAGFAWPASVYLWPGRTYNPENQYLQIWLEYGILGFAWWMYLYIYLHIIGYKAYKMEKEEKNKIVKKTKQYGIIVFAFSLGLFGLSIEWFVLHSFVDRMIVYPFMALFGIAYALYLKSLHKANLENKKWWDFA